MAGYTPSEIIQEALREFVGYDADEAVLAAHDTLVAREALDGLAGHSERLAEAGLLGAGTAKIQRAAAVIATDYRDTHYPEKED